MAEIATTVVSTQLGAETVAGTAVAASKQLRSVGISPAPKMNNSARSIPGNRYPTAVTRGKRWTEASIDGFLSYPDASYLFASLLKKVTPTNGIAPNAASRTWVFTSSVNAQDTPQTFTVETGDATTARRFAYGLVNTLSLKTADDGIEISGSMLGKSIETGVTKTATPTVITPVPAGAVDSTVGFASSFAGAATALTRVLSLTVDFSERWKPLFSTGTDDSFVDVVDAETGFTAKMMVAANSVSDGLIADQKAGTLKFLDWTISGGIIPSCTATTYSTKIRAAVNITDVSEYKDSDGVYAVEFTFTGVIDPTTNKCVEVTVVNDVSTL